MEHSLNGHYPPTSGQLSMDASGIEDPGEARSTDQHPKTVKTRRRIRLLRQMNGVPHVFRDTSHTRVLAQITGSQPALRQKKVPFAIELTELCKSFGKGQNALAVDHLSLQVRRGEVFGLLGPNGSGKTTTINMISGLLAPTSGAIRVLAYDIHRDIRLIRQRLGTVPQESALYDELTAWANLDFHADLFGIPHGRKNERISEMLALVQLLDRKDSRVATFSGGMKRRLAIARALLHNPELIYLDEPTLGVDPQACAAIWDYIRDLREKGKTVLITTNYLHEADALCDRLAIIDRGRLIAIDTPEHLRQEYGGSVISVEIECGDDPVELDLTALRSFENMKEVKVEKHVITCFTRGAGNHLAAIVNVLSSQAPIKDIQVRESSLDEVFLHLTGRSLRD